MRAVLWILRFRLLAAGRWLREQAFAIAVLGPLLVGGLFWVVDRYVPLAAPWLIAWLTGAGGMPGPLALALALFLAAASLAAAVEELYPRRTPTVHLDLLPVAPHARFHAAWLVCLAGHGVAWGGLLVVALVFARHHGGGAVLPWAGRLLLALLPLTAVQVVTALVLVRRRWTRGRPMLVLGALLAALVAAGVHAPAAAVALLPWLPTAAQIERVLLPALGAAPATGWPASPWLALALTALGYALGWRLFVGWQRRDLAAAHAAPGRVRGFRRAIDTVTARMAPALAAQVGRDLLLVLRRFSPAVYVAAGLTLVADALTATLVPGLGRDLFWSSRLALIGATAGILGAVSVVPFLFRHELPRLWLERAAGVGADTLWRAKLWLARMLALPAYALGVAVVLVAVSAAPGAALVVYALELLAAGWVVASLIGLGTFEIAERPLLGLIFGALVALAWAALMILYRQFIPFWLIGYFIVASQIAERATLRVRFTGVAR